MLEQLILGTIQGIAEWLPISSEGVLVLLHQRFFHYVDDIDFLIKSALFLHLGTFLAALLYFRKDVVVLAKALWRYREAEPESKKILNFLIVATLLSGVVGIAAVKLLTASYRYFYYGSQALTAFIGLALLATAWLQLRAKGKRGVKSFAQLKMTDGILLGFVQGLAALPGLSRSGLTISALLLKKFDDGCALKLSFLMSLPIVLAGNLVLNLKYLAFSWEMLIGLAASFLFGLLTIDILLRLAKKMNFGYFVLFFGLLVLAAAWLGV